jgi:DNA-binding transcriptional MerR regulator
MSGYYDDCFDHITDPVQRNSVRQQWLQMVDGGLSIADVRMLLDKYPDFRFVIGRWISTKPESLGFGDNTIDRLKEFVATLPEFKDVFDKYVSQLVSSDQYRQGELKKLATIFPQFKQVAEQRIEHTESLMRLREEYQREIQQEIEREMFTEKSPNYFSSL